MDSNFYKGFVEVYHRQWLESLLGIPSGPTNSGIDLINDERKNRIGIELKSKDRFYRPLSFAVENRQVRQFPKDNPDASLYWGFMLYSTKKRPKKIGPNDDFESLVYDREVWFLPWEFVQQFKIHKCETGDYRYVPERRLPTNGVLNHYEMNGGRLHVAKRTDLDKKIKKLYKLLEGVPF